MRYTESTFMTPLQKQIYARLKTVPAGRVTTYKELARAVGSTAYRAIGQCMRNNPYPYMSCDIPSLRVPCHRVVASNGTIGGFMGKTAGAEIEQKISMLKSEGVGVVDNRIQKFKTALYIFSDL